MKSALSASATPTPGRLRRQITRVFVALSLSVGMIAATARPAYAAAYVHGCFRSANGNSLWDMPVQLWAFYQNTWYVIGYGKLGPNGCQAFNITGSYRNYPVVMGVNHTIGAASFSGNTPVSLAAPAGNGSHSLGTGLVICRGC